MHKVKTQRSGELFVKNMLIFNFYMVIIKNYKVKKLLNIFMEISGKIGINFRKFSAWNFRTHNLTCVPCCHNGCFSSLLVAVLITMDTCQVCYLPGVLPARCVTCQACYLPGVLPARCVLCRCRFWVDLRGRLHWRVASRRAMLRCDSAAHSGQ